MSLYSSMYIYKWQQDYVLCSDTGTLVVGCISVLQYLLHVDSERSTISKSIRPCDLWIEIITGSHSLG